MANENRTNQEVIKEIVDFIFQKIGENTGGNMLMLTPALNVVKLKLSKMNADDAEYIVDAVHKISHHIEKQTGKLSPYHGIEQIND